MALVLAVLAAEATGQETPAQIGSNAPAPSNWLKTRVGQAELGAALDRLVPRLMKDGDVPGLALAVVRDGRVLLRRDYGVKDASKDAPADADTVFEAASLFKPVFAYAVLKLVDAGQLDLDLPLGRSGDGERNLLLALGRQRERLPLLPRGVSASEARISRLPKRPRRPRHHPRGRRRGDRRAAPGVCLARLRTLRLASEDVVEGHPRPQRERDRERRRQAHRGAGQPGGLLAPRQEEQGT